MIHTAVSIYTIHGSHYISYSGWFRDISAGSPDVTAVLGPDLRQVKNRRRSFRGSQPFVQGRFGPVKWQYNSSNKNMII